MKIAVKHPFSCANYSYTAPEKSRHAESESEF